MEIVLDLPEPPAQSGRKGWRTRWRKTHRAKRDTWVAAIQQITPFPDPPKRVRVDAHFRLYAKRDPWNLPHDLKPVLDALKQEPHPNDRLEWKQGIWLMRGYFLDDDLAEMGRVTQEVDREDRGVRLTITPLGEWDPPASLLEEIRVQKRRLAS